MQEQSIGTYEGKSIKTKILELSDEVKKFSKINVNYWNMSIIFFLIFFATYGCFWLLNDWKKCKNSDLKAMLLLKEATMNMLQICKKIKGLIKTEPTIMLKKK